MTVTSESLDALRSEVAGLIREWRVSGRYTPRPDAWLRGYDRDFTRALAERGWIGMTWPRDLGGQERSNLERLVVTEELLRGGAPVAAHWIADRQIGPAILRHGTRQLQEEFLPRIAAGELTFCLGMSETEAGSDLAAVRTTATRDGDDWIVRGAKVWTSQAHRSEYAYVLVRTDTSANKHSGLTELIVDLSDDAVEIRPIQDLQGEHHFNEMIFDDVRVPDRWVIGEVGNGWTQVTEQLAFERGGPERMLSTWPVLEGALGELTAEVDESTRARVGVLIARAIGLRRMVHGVASSLDGGEAPITAAAMTKQLGTSFEIEVIETVRELLSIEPRPPGEGLANQLGDALLASPGFSIRGGSSEVLLSIIGRSEARA